MISKIVLLLCASASLLAARDISLEFRLVEMPPKVIESMRPYLSQDPASAQGALAKLDSIPGCKVLAAIEAQATSGKRGMVKAPAAELIGKPPETYPLGFSIEYDPVSSDEGETDLNLALEYWNKDGGKASGFRIINQFRMQKAWPRIVGIREAEEGAPAEVLFVTATPEGDANGGMREAKEREFEVVVYEMPNKASAEDAVGRSPEEGAAKVTQDGEFVSREVVFLQSGLRAQTATRSCDAKDLGDWEEISVDFDFRSAGAGDGGTLILGMNRTHDGDFEELGKGEVVLKKGIPVLLPLKSGGAVGKVMVVVTLR